MLPAYAVSILHILAQNTDHVHLRNSSTTIFIFMRHPNIGVLEWTNDTFFIPHVAPLIALIDRLRFS